MGFKKRRASSLQKLRALAKTQLINEMLEKSTIESEALQNMGYDRPVDESHIIDLLNAEGTKSGSKSAKRSRRAKSVHAKRLSKHSAKARKRRLR